MKFNVKKNTKILLSTLALTIFLLTSNVFAIDNLDEDYRLTPSKNSMYSSFKYVIDKYDVDIKVNENNTLDITENITAYFNVEKHGIYRTIPLKNEIIRLDGTTSKNRAKITNISVNDEYSTSRYNGNFIIKIGSQNITLTGKKSYTIKYTYNLGKDPLKDMDELYFNIIGTGWDDTVIGNITFNITMPKDFNANKLGFSSGKKGSTENRNIKYTINGKLITGSYNGILGINEGITIRCELPEGYFVDAKIPTDYKIYLIYILPILFVIISILLWYKYGRDDELVESVEFFPPNGLNSLDIAYLYKGKVNDKDVVSLLIYLASKGYLKIAEIEEEGFHWLTKFKVTKVKDYNGDNINEQLFFDGLFNEKIGNNSLFRKKEVSYIKHDEVTSEKLKQYFYRTSEKILKNVNNKKNNRKIFEKSASNKKIFLILMSILTILLITIPPVIEYNGILVIFVLMFSLVEYQGLFMLFSSNNIIEKIACLSGIAMMIMFPLKIMLLPCLLYNTIYLYGYIIGIISIIIIMAICVYGMPKRTPYGRETLGKIIGFKDFLENAEKDKLIELVNDNPTYFFDILPYAYVLGVSDEWIKKFEQINLSAPDWYDSTTTFDITTFSDFMSSTMSSASSSMSSSGDSGGGSSGGGSGGGGGGSW